MCFLIQGFKCQNKKKFEKNGHADGLFSLAVKWAEMAADHEKNHGHYVVS